LGASDNRKRRFLACMLTALFLQLCFPALINAAPPAPDLSLTCSLSLVMKDSAGVSVPGGSVSIHKAADWDLTGATPSWSLTDAYAACGISAADIDSEASAGPLAAYTRRNSVAGIEKPIDAEGKVKFTSLPAGLYLVVQTRAAAGYRAFSPFLLALPHYSAAEGIYSGHVTALPKTVHEPEPSDGPDPPDPPPAVPPAVPPADPPADPNDPSGEKPDPPKPADPLYFSDGPDPSSPSGDSEPPGNDGSSGGAGGPLLPNTGQLWWPVPVLALGGTFLIFLARAIRKRADDNGEHN